MYDIKYKIYEWKYIHKIKSTGMFVEINLYSIEDFITISALEDREKWTDWKFSINSLRLRKVYFIHDLWYNWIVDTI